jgi:hypothetical protein
MPKQHRHLSNSSTMSTPIARAGWTSCQSPDGRIYYFNQATGTSQWEDPCPSADLSPAPPPSYACAGDCPVLSLRRVPAYAFVPFAEVSPSPPSTSPPPSPPPTDIALVMQACCVSAATAARYLHHCGGKVDRAILFHCNDVPPAPAPAPAPPAWEAGQAMIRQAIAADLGYATVVGALFVCVCNRFCV